MLVILSDKLNILKLDNHIVLTLYKTLYLAKFGPQQNAYVILESAKFRARVVKQGRKKMGVFSHLAPHILKAILCALLYCSSRLFGMLYTVGGR